MEGIYALANPPKAESGLTMNYEFNLSGMSTQLIGRKFKTFPMIEDAPKLTEVNEFSWLKVEENALIGALESAALIACGAICVVGCVLLLPEIAAATAAGAVIALSLGVVVLGACAGASLFAGNGVFQETVSSTVNDIITQTNTSTPQFMVNISKAFTENLDLGLRVGAFIGSLVATAVCPPVGGSMQFALAGGAAGEEALSIAGIEAVAVDGALVIESGVELGQSIIAMAKGNGDTSFEGGSKTGNLIGENGSQVSSKTTWKQGKTERIDVENPSPGKRAGQIHYHESNNAKWYYDIKNNSFYNEKTGDLAPTRVQKLLKDKEFMKGINKAKKILGE